MKKDLQRSDLQKELNVDFNFNEDGENDGNNQSTGEFQNNIMLNENSSSQSDMSSIKPQIFI